MQKKNQANTEDELIVLGNLTMKKSEAICQWQKRFPLLTNLTSDESGFKDINITSVNHFIVQALLNQKKNNFDVID